MSTNRSSEYLLFPSTLDQARSRMDESKRSWQTKRGRRREVNHMDMERSRDPQGMNIDKTKCSERGMEVELPTLLENYNGQTNRPTNRRT